ncbi:unnamed protein product [Moneuplotes crassus]|uniref:Uncharacterized protein n=1 Tax=Euplotes crassus TaxID=5936 RepID=A0AAD2D2P6_EUPCR|nr:unnamed protein product [Moneuplotes crassus]
MCDYLNIVELKLSKAVLNLRRDHILALLISSSSESQSSSLSLFSSSLNSRGFLNIWLSLNTLNDFCGIPPLELLSQFGRDSLRARVDWFDFKVRVVNSIPFWPTSVSSEVFRLFMDFTTSLETLFFLFSPFCGCLFCEAVSTCISFDKISLLWDVKSALVHSDGASVSLLERAYS